MAAFRFPLAAPMAPHAPHPPTGPQARSLRLHAAGERLDADLVVPVDARGLVVFAHGSGSSRHSPRNRQVARTLQERGFATLLADLLTEQESREPQARFDINLLTQRLGDAVDGVTAQPGLGALPIGLFGASTGAAGALRLAAARPERISAVVSRGGRPDLAGAAALLRVRAPTLLLVGSPDPAVLELNRAAQASLGEHGRLEVVPGATHLFEEPGTLERVAMLAADWFAQWLPLSHSPRGLHH